MDPARLHAVENRKVRRQHRTRECQFACRTVLGGKVQIGRRVGSSWDLGGPRGIRIEGVHALKLSDDL